jgi:hypothetical protein
MPVHGWTTCRDALCGAVAALSSLGMAAAQAPDLPRLHTNQSYLEEVAHPTTLDVADPVAVFAFVFASLPDRVKVYPTENYYYFTFVYNGAPYDGNIRLDASDRDRGKVNFGYAETITEWRGETPVKFVLLDASHGVSVEKLERFLYRVSYRGKSVLFELNDLSGVKPPALGPDEKFVGPIFDESGIRFFLIYNSRLKIFHYVLDETVKVADELVSAPRMDRIVVGKRTGFAFYRDHRLDRKILIGAYEGNSQVNNYFDGPFDQLPDNFIEGEDFRNILLEVEPKLKGQIDRFGGSPDGAERYMIGPYLYYRTVYDLAVFHRCATSRKIPAAQYYNCFVIADPDDPRPVALVNAGRGTRSSAARKGQHRH